MALSAAQMRAVVTQIADAFDEFFVDVDHEVHTGWNSDKVAQFDTAVTLRGFLERKGTVVQWRQGLEVIEGDLFTIPENVTVKQKDRLTLPDGTQPPILEIRGVHDPAGGFFYQQIVFGRPERGVTAQ